MVKSIYWRPNCTSHSLTPGFCPGTTTATMTCHNGGFGNGISIARQNGFRDGVNDGRQDRATGHSYRPTQDDNYRNAPGYSSSMGDRQQYKDAYRQAYQQGYQQGYR